jgi:hypothetical protein
MRHSKRKAIEVAALLGVLAYRAVGAWSFLSANDEGDPAA